MIDVIADRDAPTAGVPEAPVVAVARALEDVPTAEDNNEAAHAMRVVAANLEIFGKVGNSATNGQLHPCHCRK